MYNKEYLKNIFPHLKEEEILLKVENDNTELNIEREFKINEDNSINFVVTKFEKIIKESE